LPQVVALLLVVSALALADRAGAAQDAHAVQSGVERRAPAGTGGREGGEVTLVGQSVGVGLHGHVVAAVAAGVLLGELHLTAIGLVVVVVVAAKDLLDPVDVGLVVLDSCRLESGLGGGVRLGC